ncbi:TPA: serine acetyltransferase [Cronobacter sakazakii]|nr:serine acetyltransferase [Cronobacter sakazakii]
MKNFISTLMYDLKINNAKSKIVILLFRLSTIHAKTKLLYPLSLIFVILNKCVNEFLLGVELSYHLRIGRGFKIWHANSVIINRNCVIGDNFTIRHCCTLGANKRGININFKVGDNVEMGAHSCIIGDDIEIGDNVTIGVGTIVMKSVPANKVVISSNKIVILDKE